MLRDKKTLIVIGAVVFLMTVMIFPVTGMSFLKEKQVTPTPMQTVEITYADELQIDISVRVPRFEYSSVKLDEEVFARMELADEGATTAIGDARLPTITRLIEMPQGAVPKLSIESISWKETSLEQLGLPTHVVPLQSSILKIPGATVPFSLNHEYYKQHAFAPETIASITDAGELRGRHVALLELSPLQYSPATGELRLMTTCDITLHLTGSDMQTTTDRIARYAAPSFEPLFDVALLNHGTYDIDAGGEMRDQEGYLIVVYDAFYEEIQPFVTWKESKGFEVTVVKTSQIPGGPTKENIYYYIETAYNTWPTPPAYVLLVGDVPNIPTYNGQSSYSAADLYYVTINTGDYFPDIFIGRFSAGDEADVTAMVDKTIYYESGSFPSSDWIKKAAFMASVDNYQVSEGTHNYVIENYLLPNDYICDRLYQVTYGATTQDVRDALNDGRSLAVYSGHGSTTSWADGPPFSQNDVNNLNNENMYPFVCSHACITGDFEYSECFGETWLRAEDKAGLAFWGASASTYWDEDDILEKAMFSSWWDDGLERIGGMTDMALYDLYQYYSGGGRSRYYFECYNVLGDPSVKIWSSDPSEPPATPTQPNGPDVGVIDNPYTFTTSSTDPEGGSLYYLFDWGDGNYSDWLGPYASGQTAEGTNTWMALGVFEVRVKAKDDHGVQSGWSDPHTMTIAVTDPPETPTITGPTFVLKGRSYEYTVVTTDPNGDDVYYFVSWSGGDTTGWFGPYASGDEVTVSHSWDKTGFITVQARAQDIHGAKSGWGTLKAAIPVKQNIRINSQQSSTPLFFQIVQGDTEYQIND